MHLSLEQSAEVEAPAGRAEIRAGFLVVVLLAPVRHAHRAVLEERVRDAEKELAWLQNFGIFKMKVRSAKHI